MNKFILIAAFAAVAVNAAPKPQNLAALAIPTQFQNLDIENYLKNPRAVAFQLKCVIYNGPCDTIGKYLKGNLPNWLNTQCKNCNEMQKKQASKAITFFQANYPKEWNDAVQKYRGKFTEADIKRFESELGIKVLAEVPANGAPKPDSAGLAAIAKEVIDTAKTTKEPIILEARSTPAPAESSAAPSDAAAPAS